jgi:hypothetical protein
MKPERCQDSKLIGGQRMSQRLGVDFLKSFAPVASNLTLLMILGTVATDNIHLHQLDIKTVFLNGRLEEEV